VQEKKYFAARKIVKALKKTFSWHLDFLASEIISVGALFPKSRVLTDFF